MYSHIYQVDIPSIKNESFGRLVYDGRGSLVNKEIGLKISLKVADSKRWKGLRYINEHNVKNYEIPDGLSWCINSFTGNPIIQDELVSCIGVTNPKMAIISLSHNYEILSYSTPKGIIIYHTHRHANTNSCIINVNAYPGTVLMSLIVRNRATKKR